LPGQQSARRLVDILITGSRLTKYGVGVPLSLAPSIAGFASLVLAMFWISAAAVLVRQLLGRARKV